MRGARSDEKLLLRVGERSGDLHDDVEQLVSPLVTVKGTINFYDLQNAVDLVGLSNVAV